jgi:hypothetical protein
MDAWWEEPLRALFERRDVILAGAVQAAWTEMVGDLRALGVGDVLVVATEGRGVGPVPDVPAVVVDPPPGLSMMERLHHGLATLTDPPPEVRAALDEFDPRHDAVVVGSFLNTAPALAGRPFLAHRWPSWVALEDKVVIDAFWDRAGIRRSPSAVVPVDEAPAAAAVLDRGSGTVWAADARDGLHGGATKVRWVDSEVDRAVAELGPMCDRVRVMPFVEGIPCSIHGIVLPDGIAVLRPVEMVTLRRGRELVYAGCATFWDPPAAIRDEMRAVARRAGEQLAAEVGFRGAYTVDGVATVDGFWPTELNPRFGAGLRTITRAVGEVPVLLLNDLIVAGHGIGRSAGDLEAELVTRSDQRRGGGTWMLGLQEGLPGVEGAVAVEQGRWRWAATDESPAGHVSAGERFVRNTYVPAMVCAGPPSAPLAAAFWDFVDAELGAATGGLTAPADPFT